MIKLSAKEGNNSKLLEKSQNIPAPLTRNKVKWLWGVNGRNNMGKGWWRYDGYSMCFKAQVNQNVKQKF